MDRVLLVGGLTLAVVAVALVLRRARPPGATATGSEGWQVPQVLDRADFPQPETPWLVAVFTSATCSTCAGMIERARPLESDQVAVVEIEFGAHRELHRRYGIEAVPAVAVVDAAGGVHRWLLGPASASHVWAAVAEAREPGSVPTECTTDPAPSGTA